MQKRFTFRLAESFNEIAKVRKDRKVRKTNLKSLRGNQTFLPSNFHLSPSALALKDKEEKENKRHTMSHPPDHIPELDSPRQSRSPIKKDKKDRVSLNFFQKVNGKVFSSTFHRRVFMFFQKKTFLLCFRFSFLCFFYCFLSNLFADQKRNQKLNDANHSINKTPKNEWWKY